MKMKLLLLGFIFLYFNVGFSQDRQWYVYNAKTVDVNNFSPTWSTGVIANQRSLKISNVTHPNNTFLMQNGKKRRNDFFVIYTNGYYFNSRYLSNSIWLSQTFDPISGLNPSTQYDIITNNNIEYFYFTNIYERDDPDAISSSPNSGNNTISIGTTSDDGLTANHSAVGGKDITLIYKYNQEGCSDFTLCYEIVDTVDIEILTTSAIFNSELNYVRGANQQNTFGSNYCIDNLQLIYGWNYINFKVNDDIPEEYIGREVKFTLTGTNGGETCSIDTLRETIEDAHDPNYVEVLCVSEEAGTQYAKYHIQCYNDGSGVVNSFSFSFQLPNGGTGIVPTSLIGSINGLNSTSLNYTQNGGIINVAGMGTGSLNGSVTAPPIYRRTAWIEFCVAFDGSVNVKYDNLDIINPISHFDQDDYNIISIRDSCYVKDVIYIMCDTSNVECKRKLVDNCCELTIPEVSCPWWNLCCLYGTIPVIIGIIVALAFVILLVKKRL